MQSTVLQKLLTESALFDLLAVVDDMVYLIRNKHG